MQLHPPFQISARLLPSLKVGQAVVSIEPAGRTPDNRIRWRWYIDLPGGVEFTGQDLNSGCGSRVSPATTQEAFRALLSFLSAAAESYAYEMRGNGPGENSDLFPPAVTEWAYQESDEISILSCEIEETKNLLTA